MNDDDLPERALAGGAEEERQRQGVERVYRNDQIAVSWEPRRCIHAGSCFRGLPRVFKPRERPWVDVNSASPDEIGSYRDAVPHRGLALRAPGWRARGGRARRNHDHGATQWAPLCARPSDSPPPGWVCPRGNPGRPVPLWAISQQAILRWHPPPDWLPHSPTERSGTKDITGSRYDRALGAWSTWLTTGSATVARKGCERCAGFLPTGCVYDTAPSSHDVG